MNSGRLSVSRLIWRVFSARLGPGSFFTACCIHASCRCLGFILAVGPRKPFLNKLHPWVFADSPKTINSRWYFHRVGRIRSFQNNLHPRNLSLCLEHGCKSPHIKLPGPTARNSLTFFSQFLAMPQNSWVQIYEK